MNRINQKIALNSTLCILILIIGSYSLKESINPILLLIIGTLLIYIIILYISKNSYKSIQVINDKVFNLNQKYELGIKNSNYEIELNNIVDALEKKIEKYINSQDNISQIRTKFVANASHELKTPIFSIKGFVETLLDGALNDPKVNTDFLKKIYNQTERLENILTDLIDISKIESGDLKLNKKYLPINDILSFIDNSYKHLAKKKGLKLEIPDTKDLKVYVDKEHIETVFSNIIKNAINYSDTGKIVVSVKEINNSINIKISDNGIGIKDEVIDKIFQRFFRVDDDRSRKTGGSGLGLAIVKHILDAHQIEYNIKSEHNVGTTFSLSIKEYKS